MDGACALWYNQLWKRFKAFPSKDVRSVSRSAARLCVSAVIAALYAALTLIFQPISFGAVQFRASEALTLLPAVLPQAIPGLTVGCFISNLLYGANVFDVVFGSMATFVAALWTRRLRGRLWLAALPPVVINAVVVGLVLTYAYGINALSVNMLTVGAGQAVVCYALGVPMARLVSKHDLSKLL